MTLVLYSGSRSCSYGSNDNWEAHGPNSWPNSSAAGSWVLVWKPLLSCTLSSIFFTSLLCSPSVLSSHGVQNMSEQFYWNVLAIFSLHNIIFLDSTLHIPWSPTLKLFYYAKLKTFTKVERFNDMNSLNPSFSFNS